MFQVRGQAVNRAGGKGFAKKSSRGRFVPATGFSALA
jgi:hypothetical protein